MKYIYLYFSRALNRISKHLDRISENLRNKADRKNSDLYLRFEPWNQTHLLNETPFVSIGKFTYGLDYSTIIRPTKDAPVQIGNFCSFAPGVKILAHADHLTTSVSTFPLKTLFSNFYADDYSFDPFWSNHDAITKGAVTIGSDVWIGQNALVLSGVTIGNGAIIGAGSVVTKNIPPYSIAVGNPAKVIKYRFSEEVINKLNQIQWWNFPDQELIELIPKFYQNPELFLKFIEESGSKT